MADLKLEVFKGTFDDYAEQERIFMSRKEHRVALAREATSTLDDQNSITRLNHLGCLALVGTAAAVTEVAIIHGLTWRAVTAAASVGAAALVKKSYQKEKAENFERYH